MAVLAQRWSEPDDEMDPLDILRHYVSLGLLTHGTVEFCEENRGRLGGLFWTASDVKIRPDAESELAELYQEMLMFELGRDDRGAYHLGRSKHARDVSGAYYTPPELAWETARRAVDAYVEDSTGISDYSWSPRSGQSRSLVNGLLAETAVADLSCGAGDFLWAVVRYASEFTDVSLLVLQSCWGYDVDPIALLVAHAELLRRANLQSNSTLGERLAKQLVLGNPLLHSSTPAPPGMKTSLAAVGRVYEERMGISLDDLPEGHKFDLIVGNPPWEKIRLEERKFFSMLRPDIASESNRAVRTQLIQAMKQSDPGLHELYELLARDYSLVRGGVSSNPLVSHVPVGELNTYTLFPLLVEHLLSDRGVSALVLKAAFMTSPVNSKLFTELRDSGRIREIHMFDNRNRIFPIDAREKFCVALFSSGNGTEPLVSFGNAVVGPFNEMVLVPVSQESLKCINPDTLLLPNVADSGEFRLLQSLCRSLPTFRDEFPQSQFGRLLHLTTHSDRISKEPGEGMLPVFEGKFIGQHDLRFSTFDGVDVGRRYAGKAGARRLSEEEKLTHRPASRFFVEDSFWKSISGSYTEPYMLAWRSLSSATNTRTMLAALAPFQPAIQSVQFLLVPSARDLVFLAGLFNSTVFDYVVRLKIPGIDLTRSVIQQMPVPPREVLDQLVVFDGVRGPRRSHVEERVAQLYADEDTLEPLLREISSSALALASKSRSELIDEIDAVMMDAYGINKQTESRISEHFSSYYQRRV